ncbi:YggS family pyridoxal phosphate-dependent enzyme [Hyphomicrobiales bacterium]|nr:YggS family pyridoxal phosphate-dependent enzyme [Hyphomicrobiales bacterium]
MHFIQKNLIDIKEKIERVSIKFNRDPDDVKLIVVTKKFDKESIMPLLDYGHLLFGENKVQEAKNKWEDILSSNKGIELHMVGGLQSNKIKDAVSIFTCIHSIDRYKILEAINKNLNEKSLLRDIFVQVNISDEPTKGGVKVSEIGKFLNKSEIFDKVNIAGLMTMPPPNEESSVYFAFLNKLAKKNKLKYLSMGMSNDFETAIALGATHIRVGEAVMGPRVRN